MRWRWGGLGLPGLGLLGLAVIGLSACGSVPRPFAHGDDTLAAALNPLVALRSGTGVSVAPAEGVPLPWNRLIALETAELLRAEGIPADVNAQGSLGHRLGLAIHPLIGIEAGFAPPGTLALQVTWRLVDENSRALAEEIRTVTVPAALWEVAAPEAAQAVGAPIVRRVEAVLGVDPGLGSVSPEGALAAIKARGPRNDVAAPPGRKAPPPPSALDEMPPAPTAVKTRPVEREQDVKEAQRQAAAAQVVALRPTITEAPGDGVTALGEALITLMRAAGVRVTDDPKRATFGLVATITSVPAPGGRDKIELVWDVTDPGSGKVVGSVRQQNFVPSGLLAKPWGRLAYDIAQGALEGVGAILAGGKK